MTKISCLITLFLLMFVTPVFSQKWIEKNNKYALLNDKGETVTGYLYEEIEIITYPFCAAKRNGNKYYLNKEGKEFLLAEKVDEITEETKAIFIVNTKLDDFPDEVLKASELEILILRNNGLKEIKPGIGDLKELFYLDISDNQLSVLPKEIGSLNKLETLILNSNKLESLPPEIEGLSNLEKLLLRSNSIKELPQGILKLENLKVVDLQHSKGFNFSNLCELYASYPKRIQIAEYLEYSPDFYEKELSIIVPDKSIEAQKAFSINNLYLLGFGDYKWNRDLTEIEINFLRKNKPFTENEVNYYKHHDTIWDKVVTPEYYLKIKSNQSYQDYFTGIESNIKNWDNLGLKKLPEDINQLEKLEILNAKHNDLNELPKNFSKLSKLKEVSLQNNKFTHIPAELSYHKTLENINLDSNRIAVIPKDIIHLANLKKLSVKGNPIVFVHPEAYQFLVDKDLISDDDKEKYETFPEDGLMGKNINSIPDILWEFKETIELYLNDNQLEEIPEKIENLKELNFISLDNNNFSKFPQSLLKVRSLMTIHCNNNKIEKIPAEIINLEDLNEFKANNNKIDQLPNEIGMLKNLGTLELKNNSLSHLPKSIKQLKNLMHLKLQGNNFSEEEKKKIKKWLPGCEVEF